MKWKDIPGYEELYRVSDEGDVYSCTKDELRALTINKHGYKQVGLYKDGVTKTFPVHRLVALAFVPNPDSKLVVNHKDSDTSNNNVSNLEWVTDLENLQHAKDNGLLGKYGIGREGIITHAKLTEDDVVDILRLYFDDNKTQNEIADKYSVTQNTIHKIVNNKSWTYLGRSQDTIDRSGRTHTSVLTSSTVLEIRNRYDTEKTTYVKLAKEYGITPSTVRRLILRQTWTNI